MSTVNLDPVSQLSEKRLNSTGTHANVLPLLAYGIYSSSAFISGAVSLLTDAYNVLGGNILDIELEERNVYQAYEDAVLKYSYFVNIHYAKDILFDVLGFSTGTFDQNGTLTDGTDLSTKLPQFSLSYARRMGYAFSNEVGVGGVIPIYSASVILTESVQDYDIQEVLQNHGFFSGIVNGSRVIVKEVFYDTKLNPWSFFGGWGGFGILGVWGNYSSFAGNSYFQVPPVWENKLQMMAYEDALWTRTAHYSYQLINNKLRLFPIPSVYFPEKVWFRFQVANDPFSASSSDPAWKEMNGINNLNSVPLGNIPYDKINGPGKDWIRRYALALVFISLGLVRGKYQSIPYPKGSVTLNSGELISFGKEKIKELEEELKKLLDEAARPEIAKKKKEEIDAVTDIQKMIPLPIYIK